MRQCCFFLSAENRIAGMSWHESPHFTPSLDIPIYYLLKGLNIFSLEQTNHNSLKMPKVFKPMKKIMLGTNVIYSPISPRCKYSYQIFFGNFHFPLASSLFLDLLCNLLFLGTRNHLHNPTHILIIKFMIIWLKSYR